MKVTKQIQEIVCDPRILRWIITHTINILPQTRHASTTSPHSYVHFDFRLYLEQMYLFDYKQWVWDLFVVRTSTSFQRLLFSAILYYMYVCICIYENVNIYEAQINMYIKINMYIFTKNWIWMYEYIYVYTLKEKEGKKWVKPCYYILLYTIIL